MTKSLVFGLGSGRCGTLSLAAILDAQYLTTVSFEAYYKLPCTPNRDAVNQTLKLISLHPGRTVGDVGFYYLYYVPTILKVNKSTKFICLKRDKEDTIDSQLRAGRSLGAMHVVDEHSKYFNYDACDLNNPENIIFRASFPKYDLPLEDAWAKYYDDYYEAAVFYEKNYPKEFKVFDMNSVLNTMDGQKEMLDFANLGSTFIIPNVRIFKKFTGDPNQFKTE